MTLRHITMLACFSSLLVACNSATDSANDSANDSAGDEVAAVPAPALTTAPAPTAAPDGTAIVPGQWSVNADATSTRAVYAEAGGAPSLTLLCDSVSKVATLTLAGPAPGPQAFVLEAGGEAARLDMTPAANGSAAMAAAIEPGLAIFEAFSRPGIVFALTPPGGQKLQFPANAGIHRVINACR